VRCEVYDGRNIRRDFRRRTAYFRVDADDIAECRFISLQGCSNARLSVSVIPQVPPDVACIAYVWGRAAAHEDSAVGL
jgi:hypothetical protein